MVSEADFIKRCKRGDRKAFEELYRRFAPKMLGVCRRYLYSIEEAEDALQEGFIKVFKNIKQYRGEGSFEGWIRRIIVNTALNTYRGNHKHYFHDDVDELNDNHIADLPVDSISIEELLKLIDDLPPGYRMVFNMFEIEGYSHKEIAEMLQVSVNTSKSQLLKARNVLQKKIKKLELS